MEMFKLRHYIPLLLFVILFLSSCGGVQRTIYFRTNEVPDSNVTSLQGPEKHETIIQADDIMAITVTSISTISATDPVGIFKEGGTPYMITAGNVGATGAINSGYLVDKDGYIDYPALGRLKLGGMTIRQAKETIAERLKNEYVKEPVVEVRIVNFKIVVLGEVPIQGTILAPNHKINIIEAIAASGGIPATGRKENVMVIRENNGKKEIAHLNLNSREVFSSPYYYLKQNDIVYVEPSRIRRQESNEFLRLYLPIATTLLSTGLTVYGITRLAK